MPNDVICGIIIFVSGDGGMADALDSGSSGSNPVRVQVPFSAVNRNKKPPEIQGFPMVFLYFTNLLIFLRNFINISVF